MRQAEGYRQSGRHAEALKLYQRAAAEAPGRPDIPLAAAMTFLEVGDDVQSQRLTRAVLKAWPDMADAHLLLAHLERRQRRPAEAEQAYRRAIELAPGLVGAWAGLAGLLFDLYRPDEAEAPFRRAIALAPDAPGLHNALGEVLEDLGRFDEAENAFQTALTHAPGFVPAHVNIGNVRQRTARFSEAAEAYGRAIEIDADAPGVHNNLGLVLHKLGRLADAEAALRRAIANAPGDAIAHYNLACVLLKRNETAAALVACDDCLARQPGNGSALALKAIAHGHRGETAAADRLVDYDRLLGRVRLASPPDYPDLDTFNKALGAEACAAPTRYTEAGSDVARQTRDLFVRPPPALAAFERLIAEAVQQHMSTLLTDRAHPFLGAVPAGWNLTAWATILQQVSEPQISHLHPTAWLSGVYYVDLPDIVRQSGDHDGWIEFGRPPPFVHAAPTHAVTVIRPEEGLLLLFPSYFYHRVLPFTAERPRISIAFDVTPAR